jgi:plastocyanin
VTIVAADLEFDLSEISVPAGQAAVVTMDNQDETSHNFSVYEEEGGDGIAEGEICAGPCQEDTNVPPLDAGTYFFQCDVHATTMTGDYIVE